jgi:hypothetical protein
MIVILRPRIIVILRPPIIVILRLDRRIRGAQTFEKTLVPPKDRAAADPRVTHEDDGEEGPAVGGEGGPAVDGEDRPAVKTRTAG